MSEPAPAGSGRTFVARVLLKPSPGGSMQAIARVAAVRIDESWEIPGSRVRCVARLTRSLSAEEIRRLDSKVFRVEGNVVTYGCRPQDSEELSARLQIELGRAASAGLERSTGRRRFPLPAFR
jgi:hypothetical protein